MTSIDHQEHGTVAVVRTTAPLGPQPVLVEAPGPAVDPAVDPAGDPAVDPAGDPVGAAVEEAWTAYVAGGGAAGIDADAREALVAALADVAARQRDLVRLGNEAVRLAEDQVQPRRAQSEAWAADEGERLRTAIATGERAVRAGARRSTARALPAIAAVVGRGAPDGLRSLPTDPVACTAVESALLQRVLQDLGRSVPALPADGLLRHLRAGGGTPPAVVATRTDGTSRRRRFAAAAAAAVVLPVLGVAAARSVVETGGPSAPTIEVLDLVRPPSPPTPSSGTAGTPPPVRAAEPAPAPTDEGPAAAVARPAAAGFPCPVVVHAPHPDHPDAPAHVLVSLVTADDGGGAPAGVAVALRLSGSDAIGTAVVGPDGIAVVAVPVLRTGTHAVESVWLGEGEGAVDVTAGFVAHLPAFEVTEAGGPVGGCVDARLADDATLAELRRLLVAPGA